MNISKSIRTCATAAWAPFITGRNWKSLEEVQNVSVRTIERAISNQTCPYTKPLARSPLKKQLYHTPKHYFTRPNPYAYNDLAEHI